MADPFALTKKPLLVGSKCCMCSRDVCPGASCSLFYCRRFCKGCSQSCAQHFPKEVRAAETKIFGG